MRLDNIRCQKKRKWDSAKKEELFRKGEKRQNSSFKQKLGEQMMFLLQRRKAKDYIDIRACALVAIKIYRACYQISHCNCYVMTNCSVQHKKTANILDLDLNYYFCQCIIKLWNLCPGSTTWKWIERWWEGGEGCNPMFSCFKELCCKVNISYMYCTRNYLKPNKFLRI